MNHWWKSDDRTAFACNCVAQQLLDPFSWQFEMLLLEPEDNEGERNTVWGCEEPSSTPLAIRCARIFGSISPWNSLLTTAASASPIEWRNDIALTPSHTSSVIYSRLFNVISCEGWSTFLSFDGWQATPARIMLRTKLTSSPSSPSLPVSPSLWVLVSSRFFSLAFPASPALIFQFSLRKFPARR